LNITKILVPLGNPSASQRVVEFAIDVASKYGASLIAIHVVPIGEFISGLGVFGPYLPDPVQKQIDTIKAETQKWLDKIQQHATENGVAVRTEVVISTQSIVKTIASFSDREHIDMIVMGSRDETELVARALMGSVASGVINSSPVPVLVVR